MLKKCPPKNVLKKKDSLGLDKPKTKGFEILSKEEFCC